MLYYILETRECTNSNLVYNKFYIHNASRYHACQNQQYWIGTGSYTKM
jgi:hypothetical protein